MRKALLPVYRALEQHRYFKLIAGASSQDAHAAGTLAYIFSQAGAHCVDIGPHQAVLEAVLEALQPQPDSPPNNPIAIMVSIPIEPDPHFRKINLVDANCTVCGLCVPICPTDALALNAPLDINQARCYGCNRCVERCPTQALWLEEQAVEAQAVALLTHPQLGAHINAIELHAQHADPALLSGILERLGPHVFENRLLSLCYPPHHASQADNVAFLDTYQRLFEPLSGHKLMLQLDGQPMSGSQDPNASLPAIQAALALSQQVPDLTKRFWITLSGGINANTWALLEKHHAQALVHGVGMGTVARQHVKNALAQQQPQQAIALAKSLFRPVATALCSSLLLLSLLSNVTALAQKKPVFEAFSKKVTATPTVRTLETKKPLTINISKTQSLPQPMYGQWSVTATLQETNAPQRFASVVQDIWQFEQIGKTVMIRNPITGASASVQVEAVKDNTATFYHQVISPNGLIFTETPTITVEGDTISGVSINEYQLVSKSRISPRYYARYWLQATRLSGQRVNFEKPAPPQQFEIIEK